jgi:hypothetical protein
MYMMQLKYFLLHHGLHRHQFQLELMMMLFGFQMFLRLVLLE